MARVPRARVLLVPKAPGPRTPQGAAVRRYRVGRRDDLLDLVMGPELLPPAPREAEPPPPTRRSGRSSGGS